MNYKFIIPAAVAALALLSGCTKELNNKTEISDECVVYATATLPGAFQAEDTKVAYTDDLEDVQDVVDITAEWEKGDTFTALEFNGDDVTTVTFTATEGGDKVKFTSKNAVKADKNTSWLAVFGNVEVVDETFVCKYDGQDGSIDNLSKYDYTIVSASGATPKFDFNKGKRLSYVMRVALPAGIKYIEFNTGTTQDGGWTVNSTGKAFGTKSVPDKDAVKVIDLGTPSGEGKIAYVAIPAIAYDIQGDGDAKTRLAGLIMTIMSKDQRLSQGKVTSRDLSSSGGCCGTYDMSKLELMTRPLPSEAIKLGSVSYGNVNYPLGSWAPFNLGADEPTSDDNIKGGLYAWGETEARTSFSITAYKYNNGGTYLTQLGRKYVTAAEGAAPYIYLQPSGDSCPAWGPGTYYDIQGTKYDAARVKWGCEWCLPSNEVCGNILLMGGPRLDEKIDVDGKVVQEYYKPGKYTNEQGFTSAAYGANVIKANGATLVLYTTPYTVEGTLKTAGTESRYWTATSDYGCNSNGNIWWNRACQLRLYASGGSYVNNHSYTWDGLNIRAVLNE